MQFRVAQYRISSDKYNFVLEEEIYPKRKRSEKGGQPYWVSLSFHPTMELACQKLLQYSIKTSEAKSIKDVIACIQNSANSIVDAIRNVSKDSLSLVNDGQTKA